MTLIQAITLTIAVLGAVLGVINTFVALDRNRVKLRVIPMAATFNKSLLVSTIIKNGACKTHILIEVQNLSAFAVTIREVGLLYHKNKKRGKWVRSTVCTGGDLPHRLDPQSSFSVFNCVADMVKSGVHVDDVKCAYAMTDCDVVRRGNSPALKTLVRELRRG